MTVDDLVRHANHCDVLACGCGAAIDLDPIMRVLQAAEWVVEAFVGNSGDEQTSALAENQAALAALEKAS